MGIALNLSVTANPILEGLLDVAKRGTPTYIRTTDNYLRNGFHPIVLTSTPLLSLIAQKSSELIFSGLDTTARSMSRAATEASGSGRILWLSESPSDFDTGDSVFVGFERQPKKPVYAEGEFSGPIREPVYAL